MIYVSNNKLDEVLTDELTIIDFYADWCGPCQMMGSVLEDVEKQGLAKIVKVNTDENEDLAREYGVMSIPTILLFRNKKQIKKAVGFMPLSEITDWIKE